MIIKNKNELSNTPSRQQVLDMIETGIHAVLPEALMHQAVLFDQKRKILSIKGKDYDLSKGRIFVTGGGKASGAMAESLEKITGHDLITAGIVNCTSQHYNTQKIKIIEASHPTPDPRGVNGVKQMLSLKEKFQINEKDLVICLISGGGSALMPCPINEITLEEKQEITRLLIASGPTIHEINAVRKHLSKTKGGRFGEFFSPAQVVSLVISDVVGNNLDVIASGPTVPDSSTFADAYQVIEKYKLLDKAPKSILDLLTRGKAGTLEETPKKLSNCENFIIGDNRIALEAMAAKAKDMGLKPFIVTAEQTGDPGEMAKLRAEEIIKGKYKDYNIILVGGETTPVLPKDHGRGGRNQHYTAVSMVELAGYPAQWVMASVGTDGSDYIEDVAGAIIDHNSLQAVKAKSIDIKSFIDRYDSFSLFETLGNSLIRTGKTGTNVCDIAVSLLSS